LTLLWIFRWAKRGQDRDRPHIVSTSAESQPVLERARELAAAGREDSEGVAALRALAGRSRRALRQAERASRLAGYHHERREANIANRLLKAAVADEPVQAPGDGDVERIHVVEEFFALSRPEQWALLWEMQPRLRQLESDVDAGHFGDPHAPLTTPIDEVDRAHVRASVRGMLKLTGELRRLVGPDSGSEDLLLGSESAFETARWHLVHRPS
jgi:hypothetical protein